MDFAAIRPMHASILWFHVAYFSNESVDATFVRHPKASKEAHRAVKHDACPCRCLELEVLAVSSLTIQVFRTNPNPGPPNPHGSKFETLALEKNEMSEPDIVCLQAFEVNTFAIQ